MRFGVLVLAGALALPAVAAAQVTGVDAPPSPDLVPPARYTVTPWVGYRLPTGYNDVAAVGNAATLSVRTSRGGNVAVGLTGEARVYGPVNAVAAIGYSPADQDQVVFTDAEGNTDGYILEGPAVTFLKAGVQYRLPDPIPDNRRYHPAAFVTVAPAVVWSNYPELSGFSDNVNSTSREFALNLGVDAVTMLNSRGVALSFAVEDYITFLDRDRIRLREGELGTDFFEGEDTSFNVDYSTSNILLLRAGVSWRF
ncbi:MAG TPA: hypothetical protein VF665_03795 [Longimicrobium sp.]|jgi:hypothetical protein|uniref:hypothetical protein n=1 Tax=Longimicrobium sp. TaxID=2029185 RepID=UPI002ED98A9B